MRFRLKSGLSLRYRTRGIGPVILLLHPVGLRLEFWDHVVKELEAEFRLIALDTPGHGESDVPNTSFTLDDLVADVAEFLDVLAPEGAIAVGCSMGGMIVQGLAVAGGQRLRGAVIANTAHLRNDAGRAAMEQRAVDVARGMPAIVESTLARWFDADVQRTKPAMVAIARDWLEEADPIVHGWSWRAIKNLAYGEHLRSVTMPTLALAATNDQSTPVAAMHAMAAVLPNGSFREIATGHLAPLEDPIGFAAIVREFSRTLVE